MSDYILEMKGIYKTFPGVKALSDVDFSVRRGEVHCLVGANGAGKSTLIKILAGVHPCDSGSIVFDGKKLTDFTTLQAKRAGVSIIYQELSLVNELSVAENIFLNNFPRKRGRIDWHEMYRLSDALAKELRLSIDVKAPVSSLSIGQRQLVELMKCLVSQAKLIVMDEPSATLSSDEFSTLITTIKDLKSKGITIVYISHRLEELYIVGDSITVLRDGKHIVSAPVQSMNKDELIEKMIGHKMVPAERNEQRSDSDKDVVLSLNNVSTNLIEDVSLELHKGEIMGIYGLVGSGRTEVLRAIYGVDAIRSGEMRLYGEKVGVTGPRNAIRHSIGLLPENRKTQGLVLGLPVWQNMTMVSLPKFQKGLSIQYKELHKECEQYVDDLSIKTPSTQTITRNLSGGNQQKVVFAKWLSQHTEILLVDEPTQGIDVGAKEEIYKIMLRMAAEGRSLIVVSSELSELLQVCDTVLVMFNKCIVANLSKDEIRENVILQYAIAGR